MARWSVPECYRTANDRGLLRLGVAIPPSMAHLHGRRDTDETVPVSPAQPSRQTTCAPARLHARAGRPLWGWGMVCSEKSSLWDVGVSRERAVWSVRLFVVGVLPQGGLSTTCPRGCRLGKPPSRCLSCQGAGRPRECHVFLSTWSKTRPSLSLPDLSNVFPCQRARTTSVSSQHHQLPSQPLLASQKRGEAASSTKAV